MRRIISSVCLVLLFPSCGVWGDFATGMLMGMADASMGAYAPYGGYGTGYSSTSSAILSSEAQMANSTSRIMQTDMMLNAAGVPTTGYTSSAAYSTGGSYSSGSSSTSSSSSSSSAYYTCCQSTATFGLDQGKHKCANCGFEHTKNSGHSCPIK